MKVLKPVTLCGKEVLPILEGGKGISVSNGISSGAFAACGAVGTFSGVNSTSFDSLGRRIPMVFWGQNRKERHRELIEYAIKGGIKQAQTAYEISAGNGCIQMNVLWEMAAVEEILDGILQKTSNIVNGIVCGAGMPYNLAAISSKFKVFYSPIVSSARAFKALWKRAYHKFSCWLSAVVYEDPWRAGGHNGLSRIENPNKPEDPYLRVMDLRNAMREVGLADTPIVVAGGVWNLNEWENWIDNEALGPIAFQFGTRPLLTIESPIPNEWKRKLLSIKKGDICLNRFSPTGFYSSALNNNFLIELKERSERQVFYNLLQDENYKFLEYTGPHCVGVYVTKESSDKINYWRKQGYSVALKTPDSSLIFVTPEKAKDIKKEQLSCMGCLSSCMFSRWSQSKGAINHVPDPRSFCIQRTLQGAIHGDDVEHELIFLGHNAYRFSEDPFYDDGFIPSISQLVDRIKSGD